MRHNLSKAAGSTWTLRDRPAEEPARSAIVLYAAAVAALGALLLTQVFVYVWAPLPRGLPARAAIAVAAGALMLAAGGALPWRKTRTAAAASSTTLFVAWLLLLQLPRLVTSPAKEGLWAGAGQIVTVAAAGWILFVTSRRPESVAQRTFPGRGSASVARALFALALPLLGLHHLVDVAGTAEAVPAWLPFRAGWAIVTGGAHIAAGVAILCGILARLAATLEAVMVAAFVLLVHVPGVIGAPTDPLQWTMLVVAATIGAAAWVVASSYAGALFKRTRG